MLQSEVVLWGRTIRIIVIREQGVGSEEDCAVGDGVGDVGREGGVYFEN